jgi:hypothetical protein
MAFTKVSPAGLTTTASFTLGDINATGVGTFASLVVSGNVSVAGTITYEDVTNVDSIGLVTARSGIHVTGGSVGIGTDNPLVKLDVYSGSVRATNTAKTNFTELGTDGNIELKRSGGGAYIDFADSSSDDFDVRIQESNDGLTFITGGNGSTTEKVRITSAGDVGIGTNNPQAVLHAYHPTSNTIINVESGDAGAVLNLIDPSQRSSIEQNGTTLKISSDTGAEFASSDIRLQVDGGTVMRAESTGNVKIDNGNLVFSTSGKGIDFSATSDASGKTSELLDDYEEGTFTPHIYFGGSDTGAVYGGQTGNYVKVGRMVTVFVTLSTSTKSSSTGTATLGGLPFTPNSNILDGYSALASADVGNITFTNPFSIRVVGGSNNATFIHSNGNALTNTAFANNSQVIASGSYIV